ncbi:nucleoside diphosphate kinase regulator [Corallococcus sp. AB049A]|uniref:Nucleoside diphosphate kinase regulator n=1 Tax=Corallococcus interemptor TaxID=2316720 RepID=A0A3A8QLC7_9BACT|nr:MULTISPECIES: nucleoside diphosphate kinase regulator [Corallococcus]RKH40223.1 nucleoside diphosphate kinase regulator [Corallococcus sp. AB050B]RKH69546.1 nucleoside diphosphate kinase regulator [Corallococcus interemptor]RKI60533.1 nucleoside diphosphate kinase regulator [Corallococcus sp. AB049A]
MSRNPRILISPSDLDSLQRLLDQQESGRDALFIERLDQELARAEVVEPLPPGVVAMNSTVVFEDETGLRRQLKLCYPRDARTGADCVSVLAPIGSALLGLSEGQRIEWEVPGGKRRLHVLAVSAPPGLAEQPAA